MSKNFLIVGIDYASIQAARLIFSDNRIKYVMGSDSEGRTYIFTEGVGLIKYKWILAKLETEISRGAQFEIIFMS